MKNYLVVIWGAAAATFMSLVPLTSDLLQEITNDSNVAYDEAQDADLKLSSVLIEECNMYIQDFSTLKNGDIIELDSDLEELLVDVIDATDYVNSTS